MHEIIEISKEWGIPIIEDAAEALGSKIGEKHDYLVILMLV